ncbi:alanine racemase [Aurantivibrio plasticivorans]
MSVEETMNKAAGHLIVDLNAIQANWRRIVEEVGVDCQVSAVVKADAYGLGVSEVASALAGAGCRQFFVATVDEALQLRAILNERNADIYILSGVTVDAFSLCQHHKFIPVLFTPELVAQWSEYCRQSGEALESVIKIDTGMHRLGLTMEEFDHLLRSPGVVHSANPGCMMSHLACADEPGHSLNAVQLARFRLCHERLLSVVSSVRTSFANSSGVFLGADYHGDIVRPGYSLYGGNPLPGKPNPMQAVVSLTLPVAQVKRVYGAATVGYGATFQIAEGECRRLAIIQGGYADGIFRCLSNQGCGYVGEHRVDMVGRVSMDTIVFDVTAVPEALNIGQIELLGPHQGVDDLAVAANTIGYEVLTQLGERYHRTYTSNS